MPRRALRRPRARLVLAVRTVQTALACVAALGLLAAACSSDDPLASDLTAASDTSVSVAGPPGGVPVLPSPFDPFNSGDPADLVPIDPEPVVLIGAVMSQTGWLSAADGTALAAIEAQVELVNQAGGINGVPLVLQVVDTAGNLNEAFQGGQQMVREQAAAVFVSCDQEFSQPAVEQTIEHIVTIVPCPANPWRLDRNFYNAGLAPEAEGRALAIHANSIGAASAVIFSDTDVGYAQGVCGEFERVFSSAGGVVRNNFAISYASQSAEFTPLVQRSGVEQADVAVVCSVLPTGRSLYDAIRSQGIETPVIANSYLDGAWLGENRRPGSIAVLSYGSIWGDDLADPVNDLVQLMRQNEPELDLDYNAVAAADAVAAFATAARQVAAATPDFADTGRLDPVQLAQALDSLQNAELVSGPVSMDGRLNRVAARRMRVVESFSNLAPRTVALVAAS